MTAARRVEAWIDEAIEHGARAIVRGERRGAMLGPTLIEGVPLGATLEREEVFGPVVGLRRFTDFDEALARIKKALEEVLASGSET